jgi:hypothetical protein
MYLRADTYALARLQQRIDHGYAVLAPSENEMEREMKEMYVPRVRHQKYVDVVAFTLIAIGFLLELLNQLL